MKRLKKFMTALCLVLSIALVAPVTVPQVATTTVEAKTTTKTFKIKMGQKLSLYTVGLRGKIKWSSSNKKIAKVNQKGVVTPVKAGKVTITAKGSNGSLKAVVYVSPVLSKSKANVAAGKKFNLKLKGAPAKVKWTTKNKKIATVNAKGQVTAIRPGKTTIVATCKKKTYKCVVTVGVDANVAAKKITGSVISNNEKTVLILKNNNVYPVSISAEAYRYDNAAKLISEKYQPTNSCICLEPGKSAAFVYNNPKDANGNPYQPYDTKFKYKIREISVKTYGVGSIVASNVSNTGSAFHADLTNNSKKTFKYIDAVVIAVDAQGNLLDARTVSVKTADGKYPDAYKPNGKYAVDWTYYGFQSYYTALYINNACSF